MEPRVLRLHELFPSALRGRSCNEKASIGTNGIERQAVIKT